MSVAAEYAARGLSEIGQTIGLVFLPPAGSENLQFRFSQPSQYPPRGIHQQSCRSGWADLDVELASQRRLRCHCRYYLLFILLVMKPVADRPTGIRRGKGCKGVTLPPLENLTTHQMIDKRSRG